MGTVQVVGSPGSNTAARGIVCFTAAVALILLSARESRRWTSPESSSLSYRALDVYGAKGSDAERTEEGGDELERILEKWTSQHGAEEKQDAPGRSTARPAQGEDTEAFIPYWHWDEENLDAGKIDPGRREYFEYRIPAGKQAGDSVVTTIPQGKKHAGEQIEFEVPEGLKGGDKVDVRIRGGDVTSIAPPPSVAFNKSWSSTPAVVNLTQEVEELKEKLFNQRIRYMQEIHDLEDEGRRNQEKMDSMNQTIRTNQDQDMNVLKKVLRKLRAARSQLDYQNSAFVEMLFRLMFRTPENNSAITSSEKNALEAAYDLFNSSEALADNMKLIEDALSNSSILPRNLTGVMNKLHSSNITLVSLERLRNIQYLLLHDDEELMQSLSNKEELVHKISNSIEDTMRRVSDARKFKQALLREEARDQDLMATEDGILSEVMRMKSRLLSSRS
ncbi:hypothetical protein GUITHDRAFT_133321 [Guillardia theta CCMP2712]|uniref:Uncharacterized protein n=1 Tax=Guillardia theta (strain CCMP2712) TaxID=905079 RepID=L1JX33_GUITC|nr:hypothetical protein GUITHDRAFT_133321 [Guillardia theta CCMP2712]EKX52912.1 hypothetical protein GUITHDRAFT_133321 [Guillardia theta CCMP2712]|eukprot:XP_005839892.1 hypothetical protein GUITHDRAFT_133321 [Guillardia theta CCMP2712]